MYYSGIKTYSIENGTGVRVSLFVSGCRHHCKGCFNEETWDFCHGTPFTIEVEDKIIEEMAALIEEVNKYELEYGEELEEKKDKALALFGKYFFNLWY